MSDEAQRVWARDFDNVTTALRPHVRTLDDGAQVVDEDTAPPAMVSLYRRLLEVGYARGWMP